MTLFFRLMICIFVVCMFFNTDMPDTWLSLVAVFQAMEVMDILSLSTGRELQWSTCVDWQLVIIYFPCFDLPRCCAVGSIRIVCYAGRRERSLFFFLDLCTTFVETSKIHERWTGRKRAQRGNGGFWIQMTERSGHHWSYAGLVASLQLHLS